MDNSLARRAAARMQRWVYQLPEPIPDSRPPTPDPHPARGARPHVRQDGPDRLQPGQRPARRLGGRAGPAAERGPDLPVRDGPPDRPDRARRASGGAVRRVLPDAAGRGVAGPGAPGPAARRPRGRGQGPAAQPRRSRCRPTWASPGTLGRAMEARSAVGPRGRPARDARRVQHATSWRSSTTTPRPTTCRRLAAQPGRAARGARRPTCTATCPAGGCSPRSSSPG